MIFRKPPQPNILQSKSIPLRILGYQRHAKRTPRKHALLSYLPGPVLAELQGEKLTRFSNHGLAVSWAQVLNELGYEVDCIGWDDTTFSPTKRYDLVVLHGAKNYPALSKNLQPMPPIVYFATGTYWRFNNAQEKARLADLKRRHGISLLPDRPVGESEDAVNAAAAGIITLGTPTIKETYSKYPSVLNLNIACYPDDHFKKIRKNYAGTRNNFLFFAGAGNVHKGLDLLLDAFEGLEQELYVVGPMDPAFHKAFRAAFSRPNIHLIGEVNMHTKEFYDAMDQCAFTIFPSCSEGQAGSVIEAMNQGLVPIVSKETGVEVVPFGLELPDTQIQTIRTTILEMSQLTAAEIRKRSKQTYANVQKNHSPARFRKDLRKAIRAVLKASAP